MSRKPSQGFGFLELFGIFLLVLILSGSGFYLWNVQKENQSAEKDAKRLSTLKTEIENRLQTDIKNVIQVHTLCESDSEHPNVALNGPTGASMTSCEHVRVKGGLIPYPGFDRNDLSKVPGLQEPVWPSADVVRDKASDALRLVVGMENKECQMFSHKDIYNPRVGEEEFLVKNEGSCQPQAQGGIFKRGAFYIAEENLNGKKISGFFHVTNILHTGIANIVNPKFKDTASDSDGDGVADLILAQGFLDALTAIEAAGFSPYNIPGGLGGVGFHGENTKIRRVKLVEWAWLARDGGNSENVLARREILSSDPDTGELESTPWETIATNVESIHFRPFSANNQFGRSIAWVKDDSSDALDDLIGVTSQLVLRSEHEHHGSSRPNPFLNRRSDDYSRLVSESPFHTSDN